MHKIVKCSKCDKIIIQCRCFQCDKPVVYEVCIECKKKENKKG